LSGSQITPAHTRLRRARAGDAAAISRIYSPYVTDRATSFELAAPDPAEIERRMTAHASAYPWLVLEHGREVLGYAYASAHHERLAYRWSVNVSVYVDDRAHRSGVGSALYRSLFAVLRRQRFVNAYAGITLPNDASVALHTSLGFAPVGVYSDVGFKCGRWHDVLWLHLRLVELPASPGDPLPVDECIDDPAVAAVFIAEAERTRSPR
jgi:phosphinothricin acetyltransferase